MSAKDVINNIRRLPVGNLSKGRIDEICFADAASSHLSWLCCAYNLSYVTYFNFVSFADQESDIIQASSSGSSLMVKVSSFEVSPQTTTNNGCDDINHWSRLQPWLTINSVFKVLRAMLYVIVYLFRYVFAWHFYVSKWWSHSFPVWSIDAEDKERPCPISQWTIWVDSDRYFFCFSWNARLNVLSTLSASGLYLTTIHWLYTGYGSLSQAFDNWNPLQFQAANMFPKSSLEREKCNPYWSLCKLSLPNKFTQRYTLLL